MTEKQETVAPKTETKEAPKAEPAPAKETAAEPKAPEPAPTSNESGRLKASPLARNIAQQKGIDLKAVKGSGDDGRIVKRDVENAKPALEKAAANFPTAVQEESYDEIAVSRKCARQLPNDWLESKIQRSAFLSYHGDQHG